MNLSKLISERFSSPLRIYDRCGKCIDSSVAQSEYASIRNFLSSLDKNALIAIKAPKDYRYLLTMFAALELGIPYIPMMNEYPEERVKQIKSDSQFTLLIDELKLEEIVIGSWPSSTPRLISQEQAAYIIFTSGTSGKPKGVVISRGALTNFISFMDHYLPNITAEDRLLQISEFSFDLSVADVAIFLSKNVSIYFTKFKNNFIEFSHELETQAITVVCTVPNNIATLLGNIYERFNLKSLKHFIICGSRFSQGLYQSCQSKLGKEAQVYNFYGPTECTVFSHVQKLYFSPELDQYGNNISIGRPLTGVEAIIYSNGEVLEPFVQGEILLGGIQLLSCYMNDPEKTQMALILVNGKRFYRTGDLGFVDKEKKFFVTGRTDDTIKTRGYRVNLLDVDSYIHRLAYVVDSAVIAISDPIAENILIAFLKVSTTVNAISFKHDLGELLPSYQIPEKIVFVEDFPTNSNGKIDRRALKDNYLSSLPAKKS
jgi:D-alanine--poly(phosphoribitol) ligase subunit 1